MNFLRQLGVFDFLQICLRLADTVFALAQFFADGLELLAQIVVTLVFINLVLDLVLQISLQCQNVDLLHEDAAEQHHAPAWLCLLQQLLLVFGAQLDILCDII